ncbi:hypothetical protein B296_00038618 [Ensete ventricosum]|uniref:Uncharacterized protein n=1 Tax=Ensete ventricosum TaxID=4639 RepID=A0A426ZVV0_ENSVE|nr:hypothetical protein B296_00038618 [Ensete ventricosum]
MLFRSFIDHYRFDSKSPTFGNLDKKNFNIDLMKLLGHCSFVLSWYVEFATAICILYCLSLLHDKDTLPSWEQVATPKSYLYGTTTHLHAHGLTVRGLASFSHFCMVDIYCHYGLMML